MGPGSGAGMTPEGIWRFVQWEVTQGCAWSSGSRIKCGKTA